MTACHNDPVSLFKVFVSPNARLEVEEVLSSGTLTQGPRASKFEEKLKDFLGSPLVDTVNSATSGLQLALRLLKKPFPASGWPGIQEGDHVLAPALTCFAATCSILNEGCSPMWLDSDPLTGATSVSDAIEKLSSTTKVIQLLHWGGTSADVSVLEKALDAAESRLGFRPFVIEDCAHAFGGEYADGTKIGSRQESTRIQVFSFQAIKTLTCGDGGAICFPDTTHGAELSRRARLLRWFGIERDKRPQVPKGTDFRLEADVPEHGGKLHMNDYNAALGLANLPHVDALINKARSNCRRLSAAVRELDFVVPMTAEGDEDFSHSSCWLLSLWVSDKELFLKVCSDYAVVASQVHRRNDTHSCVSAFSCGGPLLPGVEELERHMICVPCGWWLSSSDCDRISAACASFEVKCRAARSAAETGTAE